MRRPNSFRRIHTSVSSIVSAEPRCSTCHAHSNTTVAALLDRFPFNLCPTPPPRKHSLSYSLGTVPLLIAFPPSPSIAGTDTTVTQCSWLPLRILQLGLELSTNSR